MIELDRLEAVLANPIGRNEEYWLMVEALPDLIRVARAAKKHLDLDNAESYTELYAALAPLYREDRRS